MLWFIHIRIALDVWLLWIVHLNRAGWFTRRKKHDLLCIDINSMSFRDSAGLKLFLFMTGFNKRKRKEQIFLKDKRISLNYCFVVFSSHCTRTHTQTYVKYCKIRFYVFIFTLTSFKVHDFYVLSYVRFPSTWQGLSPPVLFHFRLFSPAWHFYHVSSVDALSSGEELCLRDIGCPWCEQLRITHLSS